MTLHHFPLPPPMILANISAWRWDAARTAFSCTESIYDSCAFDERTVPDDAPVSSLWISCTMGGNSLDTGENPGTSLS